MIRTVRPSDARLTVVGFQAQFGRTKWEQGSFVRYGLLLATDGPWCMILKDGDTTPEVVHKTHVWVEELATLDRTEVLQEVCDFLKEIITGGHSADLDGPAGLLYMKLTQLPEMQGADRKVSTHFGMSDVESLVKVLTRNPVMLTALERRLTEESGKTGVQSGASDPA